MVGWGWLIAAWAIGELMGFATVIICMGSGDKAEKRKRKELENLKLIYPEEEQSLVFVPSDKYEEFIAARKEKAADAGTSTAAHMGRKDYFL